MDYTNKKYQMNVLSNTSSKQFVNKNINIVLGAILILLLSIFSDSLIPLINKKTIHFFFNKNIYINYIILLFVIYFLIDFAYQNTKSPIYELGLSFIIMIIFIMYSKVHYTINIIVFICLAAIYFVNDIIEYRKKNTSINNNDINNNDIFLNIRLFLIIISITLLFSGYMIYLL